MTQIQATTTRGLAEFTVEDNLDSLNTALAARGIAADDVVSIIPIAAITPAIGDWKAKLRVIHRR